MTPLLDALRADDIAHARLAAELRDLAQASEEARDHVRRVYWLPTRELAAIVARIREHLAPLPK